MNTEVKRSCCIILLALLALSLWAEDTYRESGRASWYGPGFQGRPTASGERFDSGQLTAAHKTLPFGTIVRVTNRANGRSVLVRINDRGPFVKGRIIDLSRAAAEALDMLKTGTAEVTIEIVNSAPVPMNEKPGTQGGTKTLQVASFGSRANAETLREELQKTGLEAEIVRSGIYSRVVIVNVKQDELDDVLKKLRKLGYEKPLIR